MKCGIVSEMGSGPIFKITTPDNKVYPSLCDKLMYGDVKNGDIVNFIETRLFIKGNKMHNSHILLMADYVKKTKNLELKRTVN